MFTSRAEFRLHLRIDNADRRLTPHGRRIGLIGDEAWADFQAKQARAQKLAVLLEKTRVSGELLEKIERAQQERLAAGVIADSDEADGTSEPVQATASVGKLNNAIGSSTAQLLKRPEIVIEDFTAVVRESYPEFFAEIAGQNPPQRHGDTEESQLSSAARNEMKTVETEIKYSGYLDQQRKSIDRLKKSEQRVIPDWFDYGKVSGLSREMNEKLQRVRPRTLGHASRIPGVTPAAVTLINVYIEIQGKRFAAAQSSLT
jgi:tRNA uridine 5-carboxymethylaminomethyl modification enzyme